MECLLMALRDISLRCGIWSLSGHSGLWQAVRPADLWVHGLGCDCRRVGTVRVRRRYDHGAERGLKIAKIRLRKFDRSHHQADAAAAPDNTNRVRFTPESCRGPR
jgi:hypothetical protein